MALRGATVRSAVTTGDPSITAHTGDGHHLTTLRDRRMPLPGVQQLRGSIPVTIASSSPEGGLLSTTDAPATPAFRHSALALAVASLAVWVVRSLRRWRAPSQGPRASFICMAYGEDDDGQRRNASLSRRLATESRGMRATTAPSRFGPRPTFSRPRDAPPRARLDPDTIQRLRQDVARHIANWKLVNTRSYFTACPKGLEGVLADELRDIGAAEVKVGLGVTLDVAALDVVLVDVVIAVVAAEEMETVAVETVAGAVVVPEAVGVERRTKRNGFHAQNSGVLSSRVRLRAWSRSTCSLCPSRSTRLWSTSWDQP